RQQPRRARAAARGDRPQELALLRQRRWRALEYHRRLAHRELRAPRHRAVGLSPRRAPAPAHLAAPPSPRAQPQALESDPREGRHSQAAPRPHAAGARRTSGTSVDVGADAVRDVVCRTVTIESTYASDVALVG